MTTAEKKIEELAEGFKERGYKVTTKMIQLYPGWPEQEETTCTVKPKNAGPKITFTFVGHDKGDESRVDVEVGCYGHFYGRNARCIVRSPDELSVAGLIDFAKDEIQVHISALVRSVEKLKDSLATV